MICDFYGGPADGDTRVISDERCDIGTVHEWVQVPEGIPMHADFADPEEPVRTCTAFYRLTGIVNKMGFKIAHLEYMRE